MTKRFIVSLLIAIAAILTPLAASVAGFGVDTASADPTLPCHMC